MIDRDHRLSFTRRAHLPSMSRGSVYHLTLQTCAADLALMRRIDELHLEHPFMSARGARRQLQREGVAAGRRHLTTLVKRHRQGLADSAPVYPCVPVDPWMPAVAKYCDSVRWQLRRWLV